MKNIIIILLFNVFCLIKAGGCNLNCDINIDSLFITNLIELNESVKGSSKYVVVQERNNIMFLYVISLLSGKDFISDPHNAAINFETILEIENWYRRKKKYITCEKIKKAYSLLYPPLFKTFEDFEKYSNELDQLKIKDE